MIPSLIPFAFLTLLRVSYRPRPDYCKSGPLAGVNFDVKCVSEVRISPRARFGYLSLPTPVAADSCGCEHLRITCYVADFDRNRPDFFPTVKSGETDGHR